MPESITTVDPITTNDPNQEYFQRLDFLFSHLPDHVNNWIFSDQITQKVETLAGKYNLPDEQTRLLARTIGRTILKDLALVGLAPELRKALKLSEETSRRLAIEIALTQLLIIRDHLPDVEDFIRRLGGVLPVVLPPLLKTAENEPVAATAFSLTIVNKSLRQAVQVNKEVLNQLLTETPIKIADFDQPARPTIKNWLADYVKTKGAGHHESLERSDYLFNNANARALDDKQRQQVAEILKSYDDDSSLSFDANTKLIPIERLGQAETTSRPSAAPRPEGEARSEGAAAPNPAYREPISEEEAAGPFRSTASDVPPPPPRPAPRLDGNIVDLSGKE